MEIFASGIAMNILKKLMRGIALPDIKPLKATRIKIVKSRGHWCLHRQFGQENKRESRIRPKTFKVLVYDKDGIVY